jgi:hypothetical protein
MRRNLKKWSVNVKDEEEMAQEYIQWLYMILTMFIFRVLLADLLSLHKQAARKLRVVKSVTDISKM